jgi:hypothetical protein
MFSIAFVVMFREGTKGSASTGTSSTSSASGVTPEFVVEMAATALRSNPVPKRIDSATTLVDVQAEDLDLVYVYRVVLPKTVKFSAVRPTLAAGLVKGVCDKQGMVDALRWGLQGFVYRYTDTRGRQLGEVRIGRGDC